MSLSAIMGSLKDLVINVLNLGFPVGEYRITFLQLSIGYFLLHVVFRLFYGAVEGRRSGDD